MKKKEICTCAECQEVSLKILLKAIEQNYPNKNDAAEEASRYLGKMNTDVAVEIIKSGLRAILVQVVTSFETDNHAEMH